MEICGDFSREKSFHPPLRFLSEQVPKESGDFFIERFSDRSLVDPSFSPMHFDECEKGDVEQPQKAEGQDRAEAGGGSHKGT